jgi:UrcA family protein
MNTLIASRRAGALRMALPIALALATAALMSSRAHAADADTISISAPAVKTIGRDGATGAPIEQVTVTAHVQYRRGSLTQKSGVALLEKNVRHAAYEACAQASIEDQDEEMCVRDAIASARPQIDAAVARARNPNG